MSGPIDLHAAAALHVRLLASFDSSSQAEILALVHGVLAGETARDEDALEPVELEAVEQLDYRPIPCRS